MMKKLALAAALTAAFAGSAFAQSSVTLYGRVNTSVEYQDNESIDKTVVRNNSSRWGLRGSEDLGGGLGAFFQLESGFNSDTGTGSGGFSREAFVGLKSASLGQVKVGRITSALYYSTLDYIGNFNHDTGTTSEDNIYARNYFDGVTSNNAVEYTSPSFGPVSFALTASASEGTQPKTYEGVVNFDQGSLHVGGGFSQTKNAADQKELEFFSGAVSYGFGPFNVGVAYENDKTFATSSTGDLGKRDAFTVTGQYNLGASEFHLSVGYADKWKNVAADTKYLQYTLGYKYKLSKRTAVYGFYFAGDNKQPFAGNLYSGTGNVSAIADNTFSSIGLGIRHNF